MDAASRPEPATTAMVTIQDALPLRAQDILVDMEERMNKMSKRLASHVSRMQNRIHRFPQGLREIGIGGADHRYVAPSVVAIGPYHHGLSQLREMEEVKHAAAYRFCIHSGRPVREVYAKILSIADDARHCYDDDTAVAALSDVEFAAMMFLDGCFLLRLIAERHSRLFLGSLLLSRPSIRKDIFLLENQIPWLVLEALMEFVSVDVRRYVADIGQMFFPRKLVANKDRPWTPLGFTAPAADESGRGNGGNDIVEGQKPAHLLGLLWLGLSRSLPRELHLYHAGGSASQSISAVELAQIGVKLTASAATCFTDMSFRKAVFGKLSLSPVLLNDVSACWLFNLAALEATTATGASRESDDGLAVSSYLSVLAMLMDRGEDVQKLRANQLLYSTFSNKQTLRFFKGLAQHVRLGGRYFAILEDIETYRRHRAFLIFVHRLLYNSFKAMTIATLFSIVGVLVGMFKIMLSNKKL